MNRENCPGCLQRYEGVVRIPKNARCGHTTCVICLSASSKCVICKKRTEKDPRQLPTNFAILQRESLTYYCLEDKMLATTNCLKKNHDVTSLESHFKKQLKVSNKAVISFNDTLVKAVPIALSIRKNAQDLLNTVLSQQNNVKLLNKQLESVNSLDAGELQACAFEVTECLKREKALQLLSVKKGALHIEFQGDESYAISLNVADLTVKQPGVAAAVQWLLYSLSNSALLQQNKQPAERQASSSGRQGTDQVRAQINVPEGQSRRAKPSDKGTAKTGIAIKQPALQNSAKGSPGPGTGGHQKAEAQYRRAQRQEKSITITEDGELDLGPSGVGAAPQGKMIEEKRTLLSGRDNEVTELRGITGSADPEFCSSLIKKHSKSLEILEVRQVQAPQVFLLPELSQLWSLKLIGVSGTLPKLGLLPRSVVRSLFLNLPRPVQLNLWTAFSSSLENLALRVEVSVGPNVHDELKKYADKSEHLRNLHLIRRDASAHNKRECEEQLYEVRRVLYDVRVTCSLCKSMEEED